jgi:CspA family cold shock protein|tara:strand:+ start:5206 stop:5451 length:246 start_codon:yes stop_codon:yes gene_type:complete
MMLKQFINIFKKTKNIEVMKEGTVKFFNNAKGFGFIKINDSDDEIFVHSTNLLEDIRENDKVKFAVEKGEKGLSAVKVSLV